ncbi:MobP1 family relaxase [Aliarcobacter butzleri]|uniref:MobP1 family relaxase n=1 Tax=Aliarcobacter butzleri TaxID=28197 RepID=UPI00126115DC|nr:MobP1 family relaxase [Aliarcobacter butzleri]MCG3653314.1 spore coat protein CotH [Aliarcobacter butzleri]MDN5130005.1 spore coat protein CotH [Aliarcobacter butzleri]
MTKRMKVFDEDELRAKRVFTRIERNSKSAFAYKHKSTIKNTKKFDTPFSKEVVVKLTGASNNYQQWKKHFDYNIKKFDYTLFEDENIIYKGDDELKQFEQYFNDFGPQIPNQSEIKGKGKREVLQFAFSMKHHETTPADKLMEAVIKTVKEKYPNNASYFVYHSDTDNPHIHCDLKIAGADGKRIDVRKADLLQLRKKFAKNLNDLGIEAYATSKKERLKDKGIEKERLEDMKKHHYEVVEFGKAKYKFDNKNSESYFVSYKTKSGDITAIWGKELENVIKDNNIVPGEFVKFKKVDKTPVETVIRKKSKNGKREVYKKTSFKDVWDCSILGRAEKDLIVNPNIKDKKVSYNYEEQQLSDIEKKNAQFLKMKKEREAKQGLNILSNVKGNKFSHLKKKDDLER